MIRWNAFLAIVSFFSFANHRLLYSVYMMKAKAEAEAKEMQAKGMKRGEDFLDCKWVVFFLLLSRNFGAILLFLLLGAY